MSPVCALKKQQLELLHFVSKTSSSMKSTFHILKITEYYSLLALFKTRTVVLITQFCLCALLLYSSKDSFVKWWDLDTQHCFKTIVGHRSEVRDFILYDH